MNKPIVIAVVSAIAAVFLFLAAGVAIGGSYLLTLHTLAVAQANHANSNARQAKAALAAAKGECVALEKFDAARDGITFAHADAAHPSELYLSRMTASVHDLVIKSGCSYILRGRYPPGESPPGG